MAFALAQSKFDLHPAALEIHPEAWKGEAFLVGRLGQLENLVLVQEKPAGALRSVLDVLSCGLPWLDVTPVEEGFLPLDADKGI